MFIFTANNKGKKMNQQNNNNIKEEQELDTSGFASETTEQEVSNKPLNVTIRIITPHDIQTSLLQI